MLAASATKSCTDSVSRIRPTAIPMAALYTLLYVAPAEEAVAIALGEHPRRELPGIFLKHLGDPQLSALWQAAVADPSQAGSTLLGDVLFQASETGPFVLRTPQGVVEAIAAIEDERMRQVATAWSQHPELAARHVEELAGVLAQLRALTRQALAGGQSVLQVTDI